MQVAVEDAVQQRALEERDDLAPQYSRRVDAGVMHARYVVPGKASELLHHEHPFGHEAGVGTRDDDRALVRHRQHPTGVEHVGGLEAEVQLLGDGLGEELNESGWVGEG